MVLSQTIIVLLLVCDWCAACVDTPFLSSIAPKLSEEVPNAQEVRDAMRRRFGEEAEILLADEELH